MDTVVDNAKGRKTLVAIRLPKLATARLALVPLVEAHARALLAYYERNRDYLQLWEPKRGERFYTLEHQRSEIARTVADTALGICARFVAFESGSDEITASFNLSNIRRGVNHAAIVGYSVDQRRAGCGYATEILTEVVRFAFDDLNLHRIDASYQPENLASARVLAKNGFAIEGRARDYLYLNGAWRDGVLVAKINDTWRAIA